MSDHSDNSDAESLSGSESGISDENEYDEVNEVDDGPLFSAHAHLHIPNLL